MRVCQATKREEHMMKPFRRRQKLAPCQCVLWATSALGSFSGERGDLLRAKAYLTKARDLYCEWGAIAKVDDMSSRFKECFEEGSEIATIHLGTATSGGVLRARSRLDDLSPFLLHNIKRMSLMLSSDRRLEES